MTKNFFLILFSLTVTIFSLEVFSRFFINDGMNLDYEMSKYAKDLKVLSSNEKVGIEHIKNKSGKYMGVNIKLNSLGMRNDYEYNEKKKKVLMLGDSMTLGWGSNKTFSSYLDYYTKNKLNFYNAGIGNTNTIMQINNFFYNFETFKFDIIFLNFFINDLENVSISNVNFFEKNSYLYLLLKSNVKRFNFRIKKTDWGNYYKNTFKNQDMLNKTFEEILRLNDYCKKNKIEFVVHFIPELRNLKQYHFVEETDLIKKFLKEKNIIYLDSIVTLKNYKEEDLWVSKSDSHGNDLMHNEVAKFLFKKYFIKFL